MSFLTDVWNINTQQFWLRGEQPDRPVRLDPNTGMWNVYRYSDAVRVLGDPATFASDIVRVLPEHMLRARPPTVEGDLMRMDPPDHKKLRSLVGEFFTRQAIADLEPRIAAFTHELLDAIAGSDRMELVADLAYPLSVMVIAELLGLPTSSHRLFKPWIDTMLQTPTGFSVADPSAEQDRMSDSTFEREQWFIDYLSVHVAERRRQPRNDVLTRLVEAEVDGRRLTDNQILGIANLLLIAGHLPSMLMLSSAVLCLDAYPEHLARARADRSLLPAVLEESLRFFSPAASMMRVTNTATELGGVHIPADQVVQVWLAVANRDPLRFPEPDVFDPTRDPNPHLGFGRGSHFCPGAPLARIEGRIALNILLDRCPHLRTDPAEPPELVTLPTITGVRRLPLRLTPSPA